VSGEKDRSIADPDSLLPEAFNQEPARHSPEWIKPEWAYIHCPCEASNLSIDQTTAAVGRCVSIFSITASERRWQVKLTRCCRKP
jgi:hypothetical protein